MESRHAAPAGSRAQKTDAVRRCGGDGAAGDAAGPAYRAGRTTRPRRLAGKTGRRRAKTARLAPTRAGRPARFRGRYAGDRKTLLRRVHDHGRELHGALVPVRQSQPYAGHALDQTVPSAPDAAVWHRASVPLFTSRGILKPGW